MMDVLYVTVLGIGLYFLSDRLLDWIETVRGARFQNRQVVFFAIILVLALLTFQLVRHYSGPAE
jgi:hypothetical protein